MRCGAGLVQRFLLLPLFMWHQFKAIAYFTGDSAQLMIRKPNKCPVGFGFYQFFSVGSSQYLVSPHGCNSFHVVNPCSHYDFVVHKGGREVFDKMRSGDPAMPLLKVGVRRPALSGRMSDSSILQPPQIVKIVDVADSINFVSVDGMEEIKNCRHGVGVNPLIKMADLGCLWWMLCACRIRVRQV